MNDEKLYENNMNKVDMLNYKGYFIENGRDEEKKFFEFGAHFSYKELYTVLLKIKLQKEKSEKIVKLKPKKKLNIERINHRDKKIDENINNIIKEFKSKTRSRNILQQENKENLTKNLNLNQMTYVPLNINENKRLIDNHIKANFNSVNKNDKINKNSMMTNIDNKLRQINNKYNYTRNREQKYSFDLPMFFSDNRNMQNDKNINNNLISNTNNININKINNNINLYKSYQTQIKKRNEVKLNNQMKYNFNKINLINDKINVSKNRRILSSNENYYLNKYQFRKFKLSPFKQIKMNNNRIHGETYTTYKFNNIFKNNANNNNNNLTKKIMLKRFINHRSFDFDKINSFSIDNKMKYISNSNMIDKTHSLQNNISNMSGNSQNKSKNITYQNMLQNLNQHTNFNKNKLNNIVKDGATTNYNEVLHKDKIQNLFKILNRNEKISRNKNINYFLNNTSYINYTNQNDKGNMNTRNTKNIFLDLNNILMSKERNRVKLTKNILNNTRNVTFNNNNNKYFNTHYINNTNTQNQNHINHAFDNSNINLTKNQTAQINHHNYNNLNVSKNLRKKHKRNNVNINININNNNKIIYNKIYEYKKPYLNINQSKLVKHPIPLRTANPINNHMKQMVLNNVVNNNINNINKNNKFLNIQLPKKKLLNRYNTSNNNNLFSPLK